VHKNIVKTDIEMFDMKLTVYSFPCVPPTMTTFLIALENGLTVAKGGARGYVFLSADMLMPPPLDLYNRDRPAVDMGDAAKAEQISVPPAPLVGNAVAIIERAAEPSIIGCCERLMRGLALVVLAEERTSPMVH
jgi:hypothetical protein